MLGGMSGGGMGFLFDPAIRADAQNWLGQALVKTKREMESELPFALDPVVFKFAINDRGTSAELLEGEQAVLPQSYYAICLPKWMKSELRLLSPETQREWLRFASRMRLDAQASRWMLEQVLPTSNSSESTQSELKSLLELNGFDAIAHQELKDALQNSRIGLAQNRLPLQSTIEDVSSSNVIDFRCTQNKQWKEIGERSILDGEVAVVTLAAGAGSRWTGGAGVVKGLHPFCQFGASIATLSRSIWLRLERYRKSTQLRCPMYLRRDI